MGHLHLGIDPGKSGGAGVVTDAGVYLHCWRWRDDKVQDAFRYLQSIQPVIVSAYIEEISFFTSRTKGQILGGQELLRNAGMWEGWLIALGITYGRLAPPTWMAAYDLQEWRKRKEMQAKCALPGVDLLDVSPLGLARAKWPEAPLAYQADDGPAVGLLLADLARKHSQSGHFQKYDLVRRPPRGANAQAKGKGRAKKEVLCSSDPTSKRPHPSRRPPKAIP